jgi:hypothetical protein
MAGKDSVSGTDAHCSAAKLDADEAGDEGK